jgi:hypothetical protein
MPIVTTMLTNASTIKQETKMPVWLVKNVATPVQPSV